MYPSFFRKSAVSALALAAAFSVPVIAQEITARMDGSVVGPNGQAISGASVQIVHTPSGTTKNVSTGAGGNFLASGLRVGGPYRVTISAAGYQTVAVSDIYLDLDRVFDLDATMAAAGDVDEIVVTAAQLDAGGLTTGVGSTFGARDISLSASISRDLKDTVKRDPLISIDPSNSDAMQVAGSNNRYNSFTLDGVKVNDDFGLNNGGYPGLRSPISVDLVEQVSVLTSPFSVEYGGFKGATLNAVTKSGENDFHGSAYYYQYDESYTGKTADGAELGTFEDSTYGVTLSGPIIKDTLFFSAGYDFGEKTVPSEYGPAGSGKANEIAGISIADADAIIAAAIGVYDFDPGSWDFDDIIEEDEKIFAKLDWNISDFHRAALSYQFNEGNDLRPQNTYQSSNLGFLSHAYVNTQSVEVIALSVFSDWSDRLSTELKISKKDQVTQQEPVGGTDFAWMRIETAGGGYVHIGPDKYRHANALNNTTWQFKAKGIYQMNEHTVSFGWEREALEVFNLFVPNSAGAYEFDSIAEFIAMEPSDFEYTNAYTNDYNDGAASFNFLTDALFLMDTWDISDALTLEFGLRYERYEASDRPAYNATFEGTYGFGNDSTLDGLDILMPRVGFNYDAGNLGNMDAIHDVTFRGGFGLFSGGNPNVWVSNTYTNDGVTVVNYPGGCATLDDTVDPINPGYDLPACVTGAMVSGDGNVDLLDPNFEIPSEWKISLGMDFAVDMGNFLGDDWNFSVNALFSEAKDPVLWQDLSMDDTGDVTFDGRPIYDELSGQDIMLTNGSGGRGRIYTVSLSKAWDEWDLYASYANQDVTELNPGTSSTSTSNFGKFAVSDPNNPSVSISNYETEHRLNMVLTYEHAFFGDNLTTASLYGETRTGRPYSYTFDEEYKFLGDSTYYRDRHLFYVPTGPADPNVTFVGMSAGDVTEFWDYMNSSELSGYKGQVVGRNEFQSPWVTTFDLHLAQEFPGVMEGHKAIFSIDIENIGNMINDEWGHYEQDGFWFVVPLVDVQYDDGTDTYNYSNFENFAVDGSHPNYSTRIDSSVWKVQFGIKYQF